MKREIREDGLKLHSEKKQWWYTLLGCVLAAFFLEIMIFNFRSLQSLFYREVEIPGQNVQADGFAIAENGDLCLTEGAESGILYLNGLDELLGGDALRNVYLEWELPDVQERSDTVSGICRITPHVQDEGHSCYTQLADHIYRQDNSASKYLWVQGMGKIKTIVLETAFSEKGTLRIRRMVANAHRPILFSSIRYLAVFVLLLAVAACNRFRKEQEEERWTEKAVNLTAVATGILLLLPAWYLVQANGNTQNVWGFRPYQQLAEALAAGQPYLLEQPPELLMAMDNPYDDTARTALGLVENRDYLWDTAYYNGHYYVYFGVIPCLIFYLPVWVIFGKHISDAAVILFCAGMLYAGLWLLVRSWCRRFYDRIPEVMQLLMTGTIFLGSNAMACIGAPDAHDVPRMCGAMFLAWGLYLWISSQREDEKEIRLGRVTLGSVCMALSVGCRPNLALYSFVALPLFWKNVKAAGGRRLCIAGLLPYLPVAAGLMFYNAIRFGSPFDFGFLYNLTVQDYRHAAFSLDRIVLGVHSFFLKFPMLDYKFPFLAMGQLAENNRLGHAELYYTFSYGGLLTCNLITWCLPALLTEKKERKLSVRLAGMLAVIAVIQSVVNEFTGGVSYNYLADFAFPFLLAGWEGALLRWEKIKKDPGRRILKSFLLLAGIWAFVFHAQFYFSAALESGNTELYYRIYYAFNFL